MNVQHLFISGNTLPLGSWLSCLASVALFGAGPVLGAKAQDFGTYARPFAATSPWNARPVNPELGGEAIPQSSYYPTVTEGTWSTGVFLTGSGDPEVTVYPLKGSGGIWDPDAEAMRASITLSHWPASVVPATGSDGHADIVDQTSGRVHSFFQLKWEDGQWRTNQYAWSDLTGRGWGDPAHYYQGARAAGVPTSGGLIRTAEVDDGQSFYSHALAMSLTFNGLSATPGFVFPATSTDSSAGTTNTGKIPMGSLIMLPADYDTTGIADAKLRKVAETLKRYGAYVVDRNTGTPFVIYVENGSNFKLMPNGWDNTIAQELDRIRAALRRVVAVDGWLDGNGQAFIQDTRQNLLSMRGSWTPLWGSPQGVYDTWQQAVVFPAGAKSVQQVNYSTRTLNLQIPWAVPVVGDTYRLTAHCTGGARLRLVLLGGQGAKLFDSGELGDGAAVDFTWPAGYVGPAVYATSGPDGAVSAVGGDLRSVTPLSLVKRHRR